MFSAKRFTPLTLLVLAAMTTATALTASSVGQEHKKGDAVVAVRDADLKSGRDKVATVRKGDKLSVEQVQGKWLLVRSGETRAWISIRDVIGRDGTASAGHQPLSLAGPRVAIYNLVGNVDVVQGSGTEVMVEIRRGGRNANRLLTKATEIDRRKTLCVIYPGNRVVDPRRGVPGIINLSSAQMNITSNRATLEPMMMLDVREDGTFDASGGRPVTISNSGSGLEAYSDLTVRVPVGCDVAIHNCLGKITARDTEAKLTLKNLVGDIDVSKVNPAPSITAKVGNVFENGRRRQAH